MKRLALLVATISLPAMANPELEAIFKRYQSTLMKFEVGMTAEAMDQGTELVMNEEGRLSTVMFSRTTRSVLLKAEGTKIYEYEVIKNNRSGESEVFVNFTDYSFEDSSNLNISNIRVVSDILSLDINGSLEDSNRRYTYSVSATKQLLNSMFCGSTSMSKGTYTLSQTGESFLMMSQETKQCGSKLSISELKMIDLSQVTFCDHTREDEGEINCETRDMSFLTAELK